MSDKLYDLTRELAVIHDEIEEANGVLSKELEFRLDASSVAFKDKVENIGRWTLNLDDNVASIDRELERLQQRKQVAVNLQTRLKDYLKMCMVRADITKLHYSTFTVSIQNNPPSLGEIVDEQAVPDAYKTIETTITVDKRRILADLKAGIEVNGCKLITDKTHLRIR